MDYEKEAVVYLNSALDAAKVYHTAPSGKPRSFATVRLSSSYRTNPVSGLVRFIVKCWGSDRSEAAMLSALVEDAMLSAASELDFVFKASIVGNYAEPSPPQGYMQHVVTAEWSINL